MTGDDCIFNSLNSQIQSQQEANLFHPLLLEIFPQVRLTAENIYLYIFLFQ